MEFSNIGATPDMLDSDIAQQTINQCVSLDFSNGIWFQFFPEAPGILITINCNNQNGTCSSPQAILMTGSCTAGLDFAECSPGTGVGVTEFTVTQLTVGLRYYLFVETNEPGTMQICIDDFVPVPFPQADCSDAVLLCDTSPFSVENLNTVGSDTDEFADFQDPNLYCLREESASAWYKWVCRDSGTLTFTLTPNNINAGGEPDDLDFALFELPLGIGNCDNKEMIRCMASGGCSPFFQDFIQCTGPTGLDLGSTDTSEFAGCFGSSCSGAGTNPGIPPQDDDNFISAINMVSGTAYALIVNNFSMSGQGFSIEFGGTGTFEGPLADFMPEPVGDTLACEREVIFTNLSGSNVDPIVSYSWNFGAGAMPQTANTVGPHPVTYSSFGDKSATLTVESAAVVW